MNLELAHRDIQDLRDNIQELKALAQHDGENIRGLARIAEIHERRSDCFGRRNLFAPIVQWRLLPGGYDRAVRFPLQLPLEISLGIRHHSAVRE